MARSLTVNHTEEVGTSSLLNVFLLLAFGWMIVGMLAGAFASDAEIPDATQSAFNAQ